MDLHQLHVAQHRGALEELAALYRSLDEAGRARLMRTILGEWGGDFAALVARHIRAAEVVTTTNP